MFCPKCSSLLKIKKGVSYCSCGYSSVTKNIMTEKINKQNKKVSIVNEINPMATEKHTCTKCGFDKAVLLAPPAAVRETWTSSEADRSSFVCGKCGFREFIS